MVLLWRSLLGDSPRWWALSAKTSCGEKSCLPWVGMNIGIYGAVPPEPTRIHQADTPSRNHAEDELNVIILRMMHDFVFVALDSSHL